MRSEVSARIGGETITIAATIGVIEAVAEIEPRMIDALAALQRGHYRLMRAVVTNGARAAGRKGGDGWLDAAIEREGVGPFVALAFTALSDAFAKSADASKKAEAAAEATGEATAS